MVDLFQRKVDYMSDETLLSEVLLHLKALEHNVLDEPASIRTKTLITSALQRPNLDMYHNDLKVAIRVMRYIFPRLYAETNAPMEGGQILPPSSKD